MKALHILEVKPFMAKLLIQSLFDNFLLSEFTMNTFTKFLVSGKRNRDFYSTEELETMGEQPYIKWSELKPFAFSIVKGNKSPLSFHITLMLSREQIQNVIKNTGVSIRLEEVSGLYFHIKFENSALYIITGTGLTTFMMDKTLENAWDEQFVSFLKKNEIPFEEE